MGVGNEAREEEKSNVTSSFPEITSKVSLVWDYDFGGALFRRAGMGTMQEMKKMSEIFTEPSVPIYFLKSAHMPDLRPVDATSPNTTRLRSTLPRIFTCRLHFLSQSLPFPFLLRTSTPNPMNLLSLHKARQEPETCACGGDTSTVLALTTVVSLPSIPNSPQDAPPSELIWETLKGLAAMVISQAYMYS